jgi:hypothetical protein
MFHSGAGGEVLHSGSSLSVKVASLRGAASIITAFSGTLSDIHIYLE